MAEVKAASVAMGLGLVDKGEMIPKFVAGQAFFINDEGQVMTASHVI